MFKPFFNSVVAIVNSKRELKLTLSFLEKYKQQTIKQQQ